MAGLKCPICHENVYSELGKGCKMCGMVLEDDSKEFCSKLCREMYEKVNKSKQFVVNIH